MRGSPPSPEASPGESAPDLDRVLRALRAPGLPAEAPGWKLEREIFPGGESRPIGTVYLRNGACPLACVYCALYRGAGDAPATGEEIARQIAAARAQMPGIAGLKLYNASSLFEPRSVRQRPEDLDAIAGALGGLDLVVVEARSENAGGARELARRLPGRLEVAIGLEAADDGLLALLNKPTSVSRFRRAAREMKEEGVLLRAFVLVQPPFVSGEEARALALRTFELAAGEGARVVSFLPVLSLHEPMERLRRAGFFAEPPLDDLFGIVAECAGRSPGPVVIAETEGLERLPGCPACREEKARALAELNSTGRLAALSCPAHEPVSPAAVRRPRGRAEVARALAGV